MKIHFQFSGDEVRQLSQEEQRRNLRRFSDPLPSKICWYLLTPLGIAAVAVIIDSFPMAILVYGIFWGISSGCNRWHHARFAKNYYSHQNLSASLLPFELEIVDDGLVIRNANSVRQYFWRSIYRLRETSRYFCLDFSPISSIAVPKSAFASDDDRSAFRDTVNSHLAVNV